MAGILKTTEEGIQGAQNIACENWKLVWCGDLPWNMKNYEKETKQHLPIDLGRGIEAVMCLSIETSILQNCE